MNIQRSLIKIKNVLPRVLWSACAIFLGVMVFSGFDDFRKVWGFKEEGLFAMLGAVSGLYVMVLAWKWSPKKLIEWENRPTKNDRPRII